MAMTMTTGGGGPQGWDEDGMGKVDCLEQPGKGGNKNRVDKEANDDIGWKADCNESRVGNKASKRSV